MSEHWDTDFDPEHPDLQHEEPGDATSDPADIEVPATGEESDRGSLPEEIPETDEEFPTPLPVNGAKDEQEENT